jgi:sec-independent protein translocase protein TatA
VLYIITKRRAVERPHIRGGVMFGLGFPELLLILVIVVLIFGTSRIPELGRGLGEGIRNFRRGMKGEDEEKKP